MLLYIHPIYIHTLTLVITIVKEQIIPRISNNNNGSKIVQHFAARSKNTEIIIINTIKIIQQPTADRQKNNTNNQAKKFKNNI